MRKELAILVAVCVLFTGCANMSPGSSRDTQAQGIPCDADPPNQPGCFSREQRTGWWNERSY
jgi:hypothetical protein